MRYGTGEREGCRRDRHTLGCAAACRGHAVTKALTRRSPCDRLMLAPRTETLQFFADAHRPTRPRPRATGVPRPPSAPPLHSPIR
jgi:hypothetical protein